MANELKSVKGIDLSAAMRVSFLEQAAILLASKSNLFIAILHYMIILFLGSSKNDILRVLSSASVNELREVSYVEQIRPSTSIKRSTCKQCKVYLVPDKNGKPAIELRRKRQCLVRKCLNCGHEVSYRWDPKYKSRSEKAAETKDLK